MSIDRSEVNRALAKAIAYKQCGKDGEANRWAVELVNLLECSDILSSGSRMVHALDPDKRYVTGVRYE